LEGGFQIDVDSTGGSGLVTTGGNAGDGGVDRAAPPTVAVVVGCGAIARMQHVPALAKHPGVRERLVLVD